MMQKIFLKKFKISVFEKNSLGKVFLDQKIKKIIENILKYSKKRHLWLWCFLSKRNLLIFSTFFAKI